LLTLDRIWVRPHRALVDVRAQRSSLARVASDHLPVLARLDPSVR
jgi:endonuclease/exonuclease/phosphatase family metal-dependent hydrolase